LSTKPTARRRNGTVRSSMRTRSPRRGLDFVVAIESVDYVGNEPGDDEDANDQVAENAEVIVQRSERGKAAFAARLATPAMKNSVGLSRPFDDPLPAEVHDLDVITFLFFYHDTTYMEVDRAKMDRILFAALKPGGTLLIADHAAKAGSDITIGKTLHRIDESTLRREVEAAGFMSIAEGDFRHHPEDVRDFSTLRPTGPVDEFVLKFQKPM
jgi:predicted methyltransferase